MKNEFPKRVGEHLFEIKCPDCIEGYNEVINCSKGSSSLCCGGCTKKIECETCNANGYIEVECFYLDSNDVCEDCKKEEDDDIELSEEAPIIAKIIEQYKDETFLKADGFDEAIIGVDEATMRLIYSVKKCIEILMRDMPEEDANEYFSYNVSSGYIGDKTPIWCFDKFQ